MLTCSIAIVAASASILGFVTRSDAALPSAPFTVSITATSESSGHRIAVTIAPRPGDVDRRVPFDLYVAQLRAMQDVVFLTASGSWSARPSSVRPGLSPSAGAPITVQWVEPRLGSAHLLIIGARASTDPFEQSNWLFRPVLRTVALRRPLAQAPDRGRISLILMGLGAVTLAAIGVVLSVARSRVRLPALGTARTAPGVVLTSEP
jgi:hypothetical protein